MNINFRLKRKKIIDKCIGKSKNLEISDLAGCIRRPECSNEISKIKVLTRQNFSNIERKFERQTKIIALLCKVLRSFLRNRTQPKICFKHCLFIKKKKGVNKLA